MMITIFNYFLNNINKIVFYSSFHKDIYCYFLNNTVIIESKQKDCVYAVQIKVDCLYYYKNKENETQLIQKYDNLKDLMRDVQIKPGILKFLTFMFK